jgi:hypothetical protein
MIIKNYEVCSPDMCSGGTSLQGYKTTTYARLCEVLGPPTFTSADPYDKVNCEWVIDAQYYDANCVEEIDYDDWEYETVTIYNWKDGRIPTEEYQWHVGGKSIWSTDVVDMILDNYNQNGVNHNGEREYEKAS